MTTTDRPFRHLCPEADKRDAMDDGEFWEHVFHGDERPEHEYEPDVPEEPVWNPCEVCGEWGPCGYDAEGRPLMHWTPPDDTTLSDGLVGSEEGPIGPDRDVVR